MDHATGEREKKERTSRRDQKREGGENMLGRVPTAEQLLSSIQDASTSM
jgi:hypothetical protein